jgi:hypothetical protein
MVDSDVEDLMDICLRIAGGSGKKIKIDHSMCDICIRPVQDSELIHQVPCCDKGRMCNECQSIYKNNIKSCNICFNNLVTVAVKGETD